MRDELTAAEIFLQVVRSRGFSAAAKALGKSASTLSRVVAELEAQLGAQLIARTTRRLHLTEAGAVYVTYAERLLAAQRAAHDAVSELTGGRPRGHLRVSMPVSVGERLFGPQIPRFLRLYPELRLELDLADRNVPLVQGGFDLAIRVGRPHDSSLRAQLLGRVRILLVASPGYLRAHGAPKRPADIAAHDCLSVGLHAGPSEWSFYRGAMKKSIRVDGAVHTTSPTLAAQLAKAGVGLLRTTEWVIRDELRRGELVEVMPAWSCQRATDAQRGVPVYVLYAQPAGTAPPLKSRALVDFFKQIVAVDNQLSG